MTKLNEIVDIDDMEREIKANYLNRRFHNEFPEIAIVGYSDKCQFDNHWTDTTRALRGVIYNAETLEVLARPFGKFFNYGDTANGPHIDPDAPLYAAFDKVDGSLGIAYIRPDGNVAIATRGSFHSEQADHANAWIASRTTELHMAANDIAYHNATPLYEIVYKENRIVVDYGDRDEIVYLGSIAMDNGEYLKPEGDGDTSNWGTYANEVPEFPHKTVRDAIESIPRQNAEGFVLWLDPKTAIKFKQEDYKALHRIISHLSAKEIWRQLSAGTYEEWAEQIPDEFHEWAKSTSGELLEEYNRILHGAWSAYEKVVEQGFTERRDQALWLKQNVERHMMGLVFALLDDKSVDSAIWKSIEPKGGEL